jgi:hypothetical protein
LKIDKEVEDKRVARVMFFKDGYGQEIPNAVSSVFPEQRYIEKNGFCSSNIIKILLL